MLFDRLFVGDLILMFAFKVFCHIKLIFKCDILGLPYLEVIGDR